MIPIKNQYSDFVIKTCKDLGIDPNLMLAIITVESNWNTEAIRYEPTYHYTHFSRAYAVKLNITEISEITLQHFSWSLGQIMGCTARSLGFDGPLQNLNDPETGIYWACKYLQSVCKKYKDTKDQISAYNAGSVKKRTDGTYLNQGYVDKVLKVLNQ